MKQKREREEPCEVCGHYHDYHGGEPCSICGHKLETAAPTMGVGSCAASGSMPSAAVAPPAVKPPSAFPSEIVPGFLFLGSYDHASRHEILKTLGICSILNTVPNCQALYKNSFKYHTVSASPPPFEECYDFLDEVQRQGGKVLVHCMSGKSRSPAVVIYFLMRRNSWRLSEAYHWVRDRRPEMEMKEDDAQRLQAAEVAVMGPNASGFRVPLGPQGAAGAGQQHGGGAGSFGWPAFGSVGGAGGSGGGMWGGAAPAAAAAAEGPGGLHMLQPGQPPSLSFGGAPIQGAFVFGAGAQQQQQQQQHAAMMD